MIDTLIEQHRRILAVVDEIETHLGDRPPANPICLSRARWTLTRELMQHLAVEDRLLAQRGQTRPDDRLTKDYQDYLSHWSGTMSAETWPDFRAATAALLAMLRARIDHEERVIYPALKAA